jgi:hypothetical protein
MLPAISQPGRLVISALESASFVTLVFRREERGWQQVPAPGLGRVSRAVAVSDADVWAVGDRESLHWDGARWRHVPIPKLIVRFRFLPSRSR